MLTGARKNEIAELQWSEVDFERGLLRLRDSKTGAKTIILGAPAAAVMQTVLRQESDWVFPDPEDPTRPVRNLDWAWVGIRRAAGLDDVRIHDLRHTFASVAASGGHGLAFIGKLLGNEHTATTARYAHLADDPSLLGAATVQQPRRHRRPGKMAFSGWLEVGHDVRQPRCAGRLAALADGRRDVIERCGLDSPNGT